MLPLFGIPWLGAVLLGVGSVTTLYGAFVAYQTRRQMSAASYRLVPREESQVPPDRHDDIVGPASPKRKRTLLDRVAPLFYEPVSGGKWKISLGRTSFWVTQASFLLMCLVVAVWISLGISVSTGMSTMYLGVLTMIFLTNLGLLAYNLGSKFTNPMLNFIDTWKDGSSDGHAPLPTSVRRATGGRVTRVSESEMSTNLTDSEENPPPVGSPPPV